MALSYDVYIYILYDHPGFLSATEQGSPYRDLAEIVHVRTPHSHSAIFTSVQKSHDAPAMSMRVPYDYLKSLQSFLGPKWLSKFLWCPHDQRAVCVRDHAISLGCTCIYRLQACDFFKICQSAELNKIKEATMPVNPYNVDWVSLRWPNGKDALDIVPAS